MSRDPYRSRRLAALLIAVLAVLTGGCIPSTVGQDGGVDARLAGGEPFTWDPARAGDSGSANVIAQIFEGLTAFDANSEVQPALSDRWDASDDGRLITFHLRPAITFSDGTPITAQDVVDNWLRLIDPIAPSPLASLLADVRGATEYQAAQVGREGVGLRAEGDTVIVELRRPATYFLSVTASPALAIAPRSEFDRDPQPPVAVSGAYVPTAPSPGVIRLTGNPKYWAGNPPLDVIELVTDFGGASAVDAFANGTVDYTGISSFDASWIQYHDDLGAQLRSDTNFTLSYYGFDTTVEPFDETNVRLAFAKAVDWNRIVTLADSLPATSMIPIGIPGRDDSDHRPSYDPDAARDLLAQAGYPGGEGFPEVTLATYGVGAEAAVAAALEAELGVEVKIEISDFRDYINRQAGPGAPGLWTLSWSADYPHAHDFLGLLLETGSTSNDGSWSNADFDALIGQAAATDDPEEQERIYSQAQEILTREAPVVPLYYGESWALARNGLLGASVSGVGIIRLAGLDWAPGTGR